MINISLKQVKELEDKLADIKKIAVPFAVRSTMNAAAFQAQKVARRTIKRNMITRNDFTTRSVQVEVTRDLRKPEAVIGSVAKYLATQEFGGSKKKKGKTGVPIPTRHSSGEGDGNTPRKKLPQIHNELKHIRLKRKRRRGLTRKQSNVIAIKRASRSSNKHVYLKSAKRKGIYEVQGSGEHTQLKMVYDLSQTSVRIKRNPWLRPSVLKVGKRLPQIHFLSLQFQFKRLASLR